MLQVTLLVLLYGQTRDFDYVYYDDAKYVLENPAVLGGLTPGGAHWAFTTFYMSNWHPLTWLSHMLDVSLFGTDPGWAHIHNAALHGVNSLLLYAFLLRLCGSWGKACMLSLVFLVHPLHVESVAWIAERKDLLCALFFLVGLLLYDGYRAKSGALRYAAVLIAFALALLAKPMAVTFPVVLLILDLFVYRPRLLGASAGPAARTFDAARLLGEKLPFFALSLVSSVTTILAQDAGNSLAYLEAHSLGSRWIIATGAYLTYLVQFLAPVELSAFYPVVAEHATTALFLPAALIALILVVSLLMARTYPLLAAGFFFYLVTLLPVIGIVQVGSQAHADRYMYIPSIGLLMAGVYLLPSRRGGRLAFGGALALIFVSYLTLIAYWQVGYWKNQHVLFTRVLDVVGPNFQAHLHLAKDYMQRGMLVEARRHALATIEQQPNASDGYQAMANIALAERQYAIAERYFREALAKGPALPEVLNNLGIALAEQGNLPAAIAAFEKALEMEPGMAEAQRNLRTYTRKLQDASAP